jgi:hypothetical protein
MRLRQVALVARELDPVVEDLCAVLGIRVGFHDPGVSAFGLENAVMPIGETFLEVVAPVEENTTAGRQLLRRGGDGGYMVIVQTDDPQASRRRVGEAGVRIVWEADLADAGSIHLHPRDVGGAILSFDWMDPPESWRWAGPDWKSAVRTDVVREITGVEIQADDPAAMAERWAEVFGLPVTLADHHEIRLEEGVIRFVPDLDGRGEGVSGVDLAAVDRAAAFDAARLRDIPADDLGLHIGGTRFRLR